MIEGFIKQGMRLDKAREETGYYFLQEAQKKKTGVISMSNVGFRQYNRINGQIKPGGNVQGNSNSKY